MIPDINFFDSLQKTNFNKSNLKEMVNTREPVIKFFKYFQQNMSHFATTI